MPTINPIVNRVSILVFVLTVSACTNEEEWTSMLDHEYRTDWDTYVGPMYDSTLKRFDSTAIGLNKDPNKVFVMMMENDEPVLRVSGENFGGISTKKEYSNYHIRMEFKWGEEKHPPKKNDRRDSGLLYHAGGEHGADNGFWMRSQEFQIQEGDCGDYWGVAGGSFEVPATREDSNRFVFDPAGAKMLFNEKSPNGRRCMKNPDAEKKSGEWNTIELYCYGDTSVHIVNDQVVMVLFESAYLENDNLIPLRSGKIQIQSEGAEVFFRRIQVKNISGIPADFLN